MTKEQFYAKVDELIDNSTQRMKDCARKLALSGAIDFEKYEDNYELPKEAAFAIFNEMKFQHKPLTKHGQKNAENLCVFT